MASLFRKLFHRHGHDAVASEAQEPGTTADPAEDGDCSNGCKSESRCRLAAGASADPGSAEAAAARRTQRRLLAAFVLCLVFVAAEFAGGALANSLAVMSDAAHMLSDAAGLATALVAARVGAAAAAASGGFSFGYARIEVLGALASTVSTYIVTAVLVVEAVGRFKNPDDVDGKLMTIIALAAIAVNLAMMAILGPAHHHGHGHHHHDAEETTEKKEKNEGEETAAAVVAEPAAAAAVGAAAAALAAEGGAAASAAPSCSHGHGSHGASCGNGAGGASGASHGHGHHHHHGSSINVRGAFIHVLGDTVQSVGVAIAGALIWWRPSWRVADPIMTLVFAVLVILTTRALVRDLFNILSERAPRGLETPKIERALNAVPGVACVHDVHCWQLSPSTPALVTAHVTREAGADAAAVLAAATAALAAMGLGHATLQIATTEEDAACAVARRKAAELAAAAAAAASAAAAGAGADGAGNAV